MTTPDRIHLTGLRARGRHGVYAFEREQGQDFVVDVLLELDLAPAAASDDVADTVHYGELADRLIAILTGDPVNLIETLAARLADACLSDLRVRAATVTVHKPQAPIAHEFADVAVSLRRQQPRAERSSHQPSAAEQEPAAPPRSPEASPDQPPARPRPTGPPRE